MQSETVINVEPDDEVLSETKKVDKKFCLSNISLRTKIIAGGIIALGIVGTSLWAFGTGDIGPLATLSCTGKRILTS